MKKYEKPICEDIELSVDENIANNCSFLFDGNSSFEGGCSLSQVNKNNS